MQAEQRRRRRAKAQAETTETTETVEDTTTVESNNPRTFSFTYTNNETKESTTADIEASSREEAVEIFNKQYLETKIADPDVEATILDPENTTPGGKVIEETTSEVIEETTSEEVLEPKPIFENLGITEEGGKQPLEKNYWI